MNEHQWSVKAYSVLTILADHPDLSRDTRAGIERLLNEAPRVTSVSGILASLRAVRSLRG